MINDLPEAISDLHQEYLKHPSLEKLRLAALVGVFDRPPLPQISTVIDCGAFQDYPFNPRRK